MLALSELARDTGSHGQLLSESTSEDANPNNYKGTYAYRAKGPYWDWAEKALGDQQDAYKQALGDQPMPNGAIWVVEKYDR